MKLKRIKYGLVSLISTFVFLISFGTLAQADGGLGFQIKQQPSSKQLDPEYGFYYLSTEPGVEQEVEVEIFSTRKEPVEVHIEALTAFSSSTGEIYYDVPDETNAKLTLDDTMKYPFNTLVEADESITVENFESKTVKIKINPPKEQYEGIIMGSLLFAVKSEEDSALSIKQGMELGVILSGNGEDFDNGDQLEFISVAPALVRSERQVVASIRNPQEKILQNLDMVATVKDRKTGKVIKENQYKNFALAPNTSTTLEFKWGLAQLPSGQFTFELKGHNEFEEWHFEEDFNISSKQASEINKESAFEIKTPKWIKIVTICNGMIVLVVIIIIGIRRKKMEKELKKVRAARKNRKSKNKKTKK